MTTEQKNFIKTVGAIASGDMKKTGILASLTIAKAILESAYGTSGLATGGKALFGIKATKTWKGKVYCSDTKECYDGLNLVTVKNAVFRAYDSWEDSIADHSAFLKANKRYKAVIGETDYRKVCEAIKAAGYATDPQYAAKLVKLVEENRLTEYDGEAGQKQEMPDKKYHRVQVGAYRHKESAELMADKVRRTGREDVFVRPLNGLYKVQVGKYTYKENAETVARELRATGISCFATYS